MVIWIGWVIVNLPRHTWTITPAQRAVPSPDGRLIAIPAGPPQIAGDDSTSTLEVRRFDTAQVVHSFAALKVTRIAWSPDGQVLAAASTQPHIWLWRVTDGMLLHTLPGGNSLAFSPNGQILAVGEDDGTIQLWDVQESKMLRTLQGVNTIRSIAFSPDGQILASASEKMELWQVSDGRRIREIEGIFPSSLAFSPDGQLLAIGVQAAQGEIQVWKINATSAEPERILRTKDWISAVAFSPDGQLIGAGGIEARSGSFLELFPRWPVRNRLSVWRVRDGALVQSLSGHTNGVSTVTFGADGWRLFSSGGDHTMRVWTVAPLDPLIVWAWRLLTVIVVAMLLPRAWRAWLRRRLRAAGA